MAAWIVSAYSPPNISIPSHYRHLIFKPDSHCIRMWSDARQVKNFITSWDQGILIIHNEEDYGHQVHIHISPHWYATTSMSNHPMDPVWPNLPLIQTVPFLLRIMWPHKYGTWQTELMFVWPVLSQGEADEQFCTQKHK